MRVIWIIAALMLQAAACTPKTTNVDAIYVNGTIWTGDKQTPAAQALALSGERIVRVPLRSPATA